MSSKYISGSCEVTSQVQRKINVDNATKARRQRRHEKRGRKASEGMTAAIILIAFIITAAGVAFVILTIGSEMQQQLSATGQQGLQQASSAMQAIQQTTHMPCHESGRWARCRI